MNIWSVEVEVSDVWVERQAQIYSIHCYISFNSLFTVTEMKVQRWRKV